MITFKLSTLHYLFLDSFYIFKFREINILKSSAEIAYISIPWIFQFYTLFYLSLIFMVNIFTFIL